MVASGRLPESFERRKSSDKAARASPTGDFRQSWVDFGFDFQRFSQFFEVRSRERLDSLRTGTNLRFCWLGSTLEGSQARQKNAKLRKLGRTLLGRRFASEPRARSSSYSIPCASQPRFSSPRRAPRRSKALLLMPWGDLGDLLDAAGARWGRPKTIPRRCWVSLGELLRCRRAFRRALGPILTRFQLPWGPSRDRLSLLWLR